MLPPRIHPSCFFIAGACLVVLTGLDVTRHDGGPANFNLIKSQRRHSETNYLFCLMILLCQARRIMYGHGGVPTIFGRNINLFLIIRSRLNPTYRIIPGVFRELPAPLYVGRSTYIRCTYYKKKKSFASSQQANN